MTPKGHSLLKIKPGFDEFMKMMTVTTLIVDIEEAGLNAWQLSQWEIQHEIQQEIQQETQHEIQLEI